MDMGSVKSFFTPFLELIQLEVTTRVNRSGALSLREAYAGQWDERDMRFEDVRRLKPVLSKTKLCHLQGWGEPLLNPEFFAIARMTKEYGCSTTSAFSDGALVDESTARDLIDNGLFALTLKISALEDRENFARSGVNLACVINALEEIKKQKQRLGSMSPIVSILLTMHRSDLENLQKLPAIFQGLGVNALIVNALSFTPGAEHEDETLVPADQEEFEQVQAVIHDTAQKARKRGMQLHAFVVHGGKNPPRCIEKVSDSCFVAADGTVAPCIFSNAPIKDEATYRFQGLDMPFYRLEFGNLHQAPFRRIWHSPAYRSFRAEFKRTGVPAACQCCWRPYIEPIKP